MLVLVRFTGTFNAISRAHVASLSTDLTSTNSQVSFTPTQHLSVDQAYTLLSRTNTAGAIQFTGTIKDGLAQIVNTGGDVTDKVKAIIAEDSDVQIEITSLDSTSASSPAFLSTAAHVVDLNTLASYHSNGKVKASLKAIDTIVDDIGTGAADIITINITNAASPGLYDTLDQKLLELSPMTQVLLVLSGTMQLQLV